MTTPKPVFWRSWIAGRRKGVPFIKAARRINDEHQIEKVGEKLQAMMPGISKGKDGRPGAELSRSRGEPRPAERPGPGRLFLALVV